MDTVDVCCGPYRYIYILFAGKFKAKIDTYIPVSKIVFFLV